MKRRHTLRVEQLEVRDTPAQFGIPWPNHNISLSFVPDGTLIDGVPSNLSALMAGNGVAESVWKTEFVHAAQTWLQAANLSVGFVEDNGAPIGSPGFSQGDQHFGDIRISARPLGSDVLAVTIPPGPAAGTRAGDVIINSNYTFGVGASANSYDIYSVALQEIGHAVGIGNSTDINSPMYEFYQGVRVGITAIDRANIQYLYGQRLDDSYDQGLSNDSFSSSTTIPTPVALQPDTSPIFGADGDLTTNSDVDTFKFVVPANSSSTINVRLQTTGSSFLVSQVSVFTSTGTLRVQQLATSPLDSDVTLALPNVIPDRVYYIKVERSPGANPFSVGDYHIEVDFNPTSPTAGPDITVVNLDDNNTNDTIATATDVYSVIGDSGLFVSNGVFSSNDTDVYRIHTPATLATVTPGGGLLGDPSLLDPSYTLTVSVRSSNPGDGLLPTVLVADAAGNVLQHTVVRHADGEMILQVFGVAADADLYILTSADSMSSQTVGGYQLEASLHLPEIAQANLFSGNLTDADRVAFRTLNVNFSAITHFTVDVGPQDTTALIGCQFTVFDHVGRVVLNLFIKPNHSLSIDRYLAPGQYTLRMKGVAQLPSTVFPNLTFSVRNVALSDPIGPTLENPDTYNDNYDDIDLGDVYYEDLVLEDPGDPDW